MQRVTVFRSGPSHGKIQFRYMKKHVIYQYNENIQKKSYGANDHIYNLNILCETWLYIHPSGQEHRHDFSEDIPSGQHPELPWEGKKDRKGNANASVPLLSCLESDDF